MNILKRKFEVKRDGFIIRGIEYRPEGTGLPIAIVSHGFLQNMNKTKNYAKGLAEMGFCAFCFDFVGGGIGTTSDGKLSDMSVLTEKSDLLSVIAYASGLEYTDSSDITLMGCSQGGLVSALTAAELGDKVGRLVLLYPALCIPDDARKGRMMMFRFDPENIPDHISCGFLKLSAKYAQDAAALDPYAEISKYRGQVLIFHGTRDLIVPLRYSERAKEIYGGQCSLRVIPKAGHGFTKKEDKFVFFALKCFFEGFTEIFAVDVRLKWLRLLSNNKDGNVAIDFDGSARGEYFSGDIQAGAEDIQRWRGLSIKSYKASYKISGKAADGTACTVEVVNSSDDGKNWTPTLYTDNASLSFLNKNKCREFVIMRTKGPFVRMYADPKDM